MLKRANKITALLVAATSIMSIVPAMAAERLGTKSGTLTEAIAFDNGNYSYYGYKSDDVDTGIWYNAGDDAKDALIEDLEDYTFDGASKYGEKYAYAKTADSNDDEYLVDLSTGKIVDDETAEEKEDSARAGLYSTLRKGDRYNGISKDDGTFNRLFQGQFGDVWYQYTTTGAVYDDAITTTGSVLVQEKGSSHIDVSYLANMYVYSSLKEKVVKIEEYNKKNDDAALTVKFRSLKVLAQDKDYFYTLTTVSVIDSSSKPTAEKAPETQYFIQKISKAKGDKEDGVNLPKSVASYQLNEGEKIYGNGDSKTAFEIITATEDGYNSANNLYAVRDGVLYVTATKTDGSQDKVKVYTIKLAKAKVDSNLNTAVDHLDTYLAKKDDTDDHDVADKVSGVSVDTEGFTWIINNGKIFKHTGGEFKEVYTCDRSLDSIDVYNEGNLIAWEDGSDAYTTVQEGKKVTVGDGIVVDPTLGQTTPAKVGWDKLADGTWNFYDVYGKKTADFWALDNGVWYYLKADGIMAANQWQLWNGNWYFLSGSGAMKTGWFQDTTGTWYYADQSGKMLSNTTVDGYKLGASGAWVK